MRSKSALMNIVAGLLLQAVTMICGLIVPRLVIGTFGSEVNGTLSSITQFLSYITLLESGVGGVIRAALYKPLANGDTKKLSGILLATESFFRKIAYIFIGYMALLACVYPAMVQTSFSWFFSFSLVLIIGVSTIAQYYFGLTYQILLQSDQKGYINTALQIMTVVLNTVVTVILVKCGASIHIVKLASAAVYVIRPVFTNIYVHRKYCLLKGAVPDRQAIKQRWNGLGQHLAYFIHSNTDIAVLSLFAGVKEVSVYTVHFAVAEGVRTVIDSISSGFSPAMGDMIAREEYDVLNKTIDLFEFINSFFTVLIFTVTALMIEPFVAVYTAGVGDVNYIRPLFAYLLCAAEAVYVMRSVYSTVAFNAGHYRETSRGAYIEAGMNIVISVVLVNSFGIVGVAIGTLLSMIYRTADFVIYISKNIVFRPIRKCIARMLTNAAIVALSVVAVRLCVHVDVIGWGTWLIRAALSGITVLAMTVSVNLIFYGKLFAEFIARVREVNPMRKK